MNLFRKLFGKSAPARSDEQERADFYAARDAEVVRKMQELHRRAVDIQLHDLSNSNTPYNMAVNRLVEAGEWERKGFSNDAHGYRIWHFGPVQKSHATKH